jgi:hypothetical protein
MLVYILLTGQYRCKGKYGLLTHTFITGIFGSQSQLPNNLIRTQVKKNNSLTVRYVNRAILCNLKYSSICTK